MDDEKRHIIRVNDESLRAALLEKKGWLAQCVVKEFLLKHNTHLLAEIIEDPVLRNTIYMAEKAKREQSRGIREQRARREEQHKASIATRKALNLYRDILGIDENE